jgi:hypothetical protein
MGMFPLIDTDGQEGARVGDRIWYKQAEYTVVSQRHGISGAPDTDSYVTQLSIAFRPKGAENGDNDVHFWEDKRRYSRHQYKGWEGHTGPYYEIMGPRRKKLDVHPAPAQPIPMERVIYVDPLHHTTDQDRRIFYLLHRIGYRVASRRYSDEYDAFNRFLTRTMRAGALDAQLPLGGLEADPYTAGPPDPMDGGDGFCGADTLRGWGKERSSRPIVSTKWFRKAILHEWSADKLVIPYVIVHYESGAPLSAVIYRSDKIGDFECVGACSSQLTQREHAKETGRQIINDMSLVCERLGLPRWTNVEDRFRVHGRKASISVRLRDDTVTIMGRAESLEDMRADLKRAKGRLASDPVRWIITRAAWDKNAVAWAAAHNVTFRFWTPKDPSSASSSARPRTRRRRARAHRAAEPHTEPVD